MSLKENIEFARKHWNTKIGLLVACFLTLSFEMALMTSVGSNGITQCLIYLLSAIIIITIWSYTNMLPRTKKGKVGFLVSIQCSNDEEYRKIKEDFVNTLRQLIKGGASGKSFHFIDIPQHISNSLNDHEEAFTFFEKTKAHFIVHGRVRLRKINNKDCHILDLEGKVSHKPMQVEVSQKLSNEFAELFPRKVKIETDNDLLSFNLTSDWTDCVAKYIIGIAAGLSGDLNYAKLLFEDVGQKLNQLNNNFPIFNIIRKRLPLRIAEVHLAYANNYIEKWRTNHDQATYKLFTDHVNSIPDNLPPIYDILLMKAIEAFLTNRDIDEAIKYTKMCKKHNHPIWKFNLAFLYGYRGQLGDAIRYYRKGLKHNLEPEAICQIEEFIEWVLKIEPAKYQLFYCLGFFNRHVKGDPKVALEDFENFTKESSDPQFQKEKEIASSWISELKKELALQ